MSTVDERRCRTCGEPETGELGWFDDSENQTVCQRCGSDPLKRPRKRRRSVDNAHLGG